MAASAISPSSSPRLPSPPPIAEDQLGPKSPIAATEEQQKMFSNLDHGAARRIRPGTKAEDMAEGPPLVDLSEIDSAFQLTEHLKALHNFLTHPIGSNSTIAVDKDMAHKLAHPPENVDRTLWLYELCRFLTQKVNSIIIALFSDSPPCSSITCPEMRASEWQYLCAVHDPPKSCCAIDYCCHTLDWAANTLTSPKTFPSRLALGTDQTTQHQQIRHLTNIFRRVYRIFAHAWFQHREMFWKVETRTGLYILFKTVCDVYGLIPEDNYTIPSEAEGQESTPISSIPSIMRRESQPSTESQSVINTAGGTGDGAPDSSLSAAGTTKRHRHSPSVSSTSFSTVMEENEDEDDHQSGKGSSRAQQSQAEPAPESLGEQGAPLEEEKAETAEEAAPATSDPEADNEPELGTLDSEEAHSAAQDEPTSTETATAEEDLDAPTSAEEDDAAVTSKAEEEDMAETQTIPEEKSETEDHDEKSEPEPEPEPTVEEPEASASEKTEDEPTAKTDDDEKPTTTDDKDTEAEDKEKDTETAEQGAEEK